MSIRIKYMVMVILVGIICVPFAFSSEFLMCADTKNGYRMHYPSDWKIDQFPDSEDLVKAEIIKDDQTGLQVRVYENTGEGLNAFLQWYVPDFDVKMRSRWGGEMKVINQQYKMFDKHRGFVVSFDFTRKDGKHYFFKQYLVSKESKVYVIQCGTLFDLREENEDIFDSIADSFELI